MNVLIINGSPKGERSNTLKLTKKFVDGMKSIDDTLQVDLIDLSKEKIEPCKGCFSCWKVTPGQCILKDKMNDYLKLIMNANYIIYSFPLYYFSVPGLLKNFIDRQLPLNLPFMCSNDSGVGEGGHPSRYDRSNQKYIVISTCGFYTYRKNYDSVNLLFDHLCGKNNYLPIYIGQGELFSIKELSETTDIYLSYLFEAGKEYFLNSKLSENLKNKLSLDMFSREIYEKMADASWGISQDDNVINKEDESFIFTKQMASLYNKNSYKNKDIVIQMNYVDIDKQYQLILKKDNCEVIKDHFLTPTTIISTPITVWKSIARNEIKGDEALFKHLYQVDGDFDVMINWSKYFGVNNHNNDKNIKDNIENKSKTSMLNFLIPFIINFVALPINNYYGAIASICLILLFILIMYKTEKVFYDYLSISFNGTLALLSLLFGNQYNLYINTIAYLVFGVIWLVSCIFKKSLSCFYSKNNYDDEIIDNPIFLITNKIICLVWGIFYVIAFIYTFVISYYFPNFCPYLSIINTVIPIFVGVFTKWFINFYPKHIAQKSFKK